MVWIWNQLHLKEKAFKHGNCKIDPYCRYSLDTRGWRKGGIGKYLLERGVLLNGQSKGSVANVTSIVSQDIKLHLW